MTNMIISFSVPVNSPAARQVFEWQEEGENRSDMIRFCIDGFKRMEALDRKVAALSWALAMRGICPVSMTPQGSVIYDNYTGEEFYKPEYVRPHSCEMCRDLTNSASHLKFTAVQNLFNQWKDFDWRPVNDEN